jgi:sugar lactone lactonase YvrE
VFVKDLGIVEANGVAVDANGQIFIAAAITGNTGFHRYMEIVKIDVHAIVSTFDFGGNANGRVVAIAVDACGSVLAGLVRQATPDVQSEIDAVVQKLAL